MNHSSLLNVKLRGKHRQANSFSCVERSSFTSRPRACCRIRPRKGICAEVAAKCKEKLERQAEAAAARQQAKIDAREAEEQATGKRKRGRKPKVADPSVDPDTNACVTDPDSGIMKTRRGWLQGYNGQIVVTTGQIIIAADVTTDANDVQQLHPMLAQAQANVVAVTEEDQQDEVTLGAVVAARERMDRKLRTKHGRERYRRRGASVEPVFGQIKDRQEARCFSMRGLERCRGEWNLHAAAHNIRKLHRESVQRSKRSGKPAEKGARKAA